MIETDRLLALFERLISFDSPSYGERMIGDYVKAHLASLGITAIEDAAASAIGGNCGNLHAYLEGSLDLPPLLFCAHLDTVEPARGKRMQIDEDGVITSLSHTVLGADDCAGIASILEALRALLASECPHRPIELLFTVAEEPYCRGVQALDRKLLRSKEGYVFDLSGPVGSAAYQAPTIISFEANFFGRASHAGFAPEQGIHAIAAAARAIAAIDCGRIDKETTLNFGRIEGGTADNIVPNRCRLTGEIRSYSDERAFSLLADITQTMQTAAASTGAKVSITHTAHIRAYRNAPESAVVKRFSAACDSLGLECALQPTFGGSDNNHLARLGIEGLVVATAMNNCHSTDEYTTVSELERSAALALELMRSQE